MAFPTGSVVEVISYLLPGFLAAWVIYGLTPHRMKEPFERVVEALIFTVIVQAITTLIRIILEGVGSWLTWTFGEWTADVGLVWSAIIAVLIGILFSFLANHDYVHQFLRTCNITKRTSYPSEWYSALNRRKGYLTLHLKSNRRLFGWAEEWPDHPDSGHFSIMEAEWLLDDGGRAPLLTVERVLIAAADIEMVELAIESRLSDEEEDKVKVVEKTLVSLIEEEKEDEHGKQGTTTAPEPAADAGTWRDAESPPTTEAYSAAATTTATKGLDRERNGSDPI